MRALKIAVAAVALGLVPLAAAAAGDAGAAAPADAGAPLKVLRSPLNPVVDASVALQLNPSLVSKTPPDPQPMRERGQLIFDLRWDQGDLYFLGVHRVDLPAAQDTPRAMGRFALELFEGPTLIERVRFDFPMLGAGEVRDANVGGVHPPTYFEPKLKTRIGVMFPATSRGTRLELWDRATDKRYPLPWPAIPSATDGGTQS
jgi:hypothetical protein